MFIDFGPPQKNKNEQTLRHLSPYLPHLADSCWAGGSLDDDWHSLVDFILFVLR